jgi:hypothetical protein
MKAVDYFKIKGRMTDNCDMNCGKCLLYAMNNGRGAFCGKYEVLNPKEAIEIVSKWAKEHPVKTYLSILLEKFPNVKLSEDKYPNLCPDAIFDITTGLKECCEMECIDCWNREYKEGE